MQNFEYHKPTSVSDAASAMGDDAKLMAGGMTLLPTMKQGLAMPSDIIDLSEVSEMKGISDVGNGVKVGAMCTHAEVAGSSDVQSAIPALAALADGIGDRQVRNRGTIGGSLANNDPAADYPAAALGLGATIHTNQRDIAADDFFTGMFETALGDDEIITAVTFPKPKRAAYVKFPNPASRYALVGVMVAEAPDGCRVAVTGAGQDGVFRQTEMEQALKKQVHKGDIDGIKQSAEGMNSDIHASAEYRAHLVGVMAQRACDAITG